MAIAISGPAFEALDQASLDDLYGQLGLAEIGAAASASDGLFALNRAKSAMMEPAMSWDWLIERGMEVFQGVWPTVRSIVRNAYAVLSDTDQDWVEQVATVLMSVITVGSAAAILIVEIAVKSGRAALCPVEG